MKFIESYFVICVQLFGLVDIIDADTEKCERGYCFLLSSEAYKYSDSLSICSDYGSILEIHSAEMQSIVESILDNSVSTDYFLGLTENTEDDFQWNSGESVVYTNFQPNTNQKNKDCVVISSSTSWKWVSVPCNRAAFYICYKIGNGSEANMETTTTTELSTEIETTTTTIIELSTEIETTTTTTELSTEIETTTTTTELSTEIETTTTTTLLSTEIETNTTTKLSTTSPTLNTTTETISNTETLAYSQSSTENPRKQPNSGLNLRFLKMIPCQCSRNNTDPVSEELRELYSELEKISENSKEYRRRTKLYSAEDNRVSSQSIGYSGVLIIVLLLLAILISDVSQLSAQFKKMKENIHRFVFR